MATGMCQTPKDQCSNSGIAIDLMPPDINPDTGEPFPQGPVFCGVCGHEITDITDDPSVEPIKEETP